MFFVENHVFDVMQTTRPHLLGFTSQNVGLLLEIPLQFQQLVLAFAVLRSRKTTA